MSVNKVILVGRLGHDVESKYTANGFCIGSFSLATSEKIKNKSTGEQEQKTEWHKIICLGKNAENASKFLKKGDQVFIEGKIQTRTWDDKNGAKRYTTEILAENITYLSFNGNAPTHKLDNFCNEKAEQVRTIERKVEDFEEVPF